MNRRGFLKLLGLGAVGATVAQAIAPNPVVIEPKHKHAVFAGSSMLYISSMSHGSDFALPEYIVGSWR